MSFFDLKKGRGRYGAILDIGSGSVLAAIVYSDPASQHPQIIWSHREHAPLKKVDSLKQSSKAVMAAMINTSILLDGEGRTALQEHNANAQITELQCSISAPWSYTVTKTISYKQEDTFIISKELIEELSKTIEQKITADLKEDSAMQNLELKVITRLNMNLTANGYHVISPEGNNANSLTISQGSAVAQQYLIDSINELRDKLLPKAEIKKISFILMLHSITRELLDKTFDVCLLDVTHEATEIGIVRDGILSYSTHTPYGLYSLAREIAEITGVPLIEASGYLHLEKPFEFMIALSKGQREDVEAVFEAYIERIVKLFHETGDNLSIPRNISLHTSLKSEPLFLDLIRKAAKRAIKTDPNITTVSTGIIKKSYKESTDSTSQQILADTNVILSAQFFHNKTNIRTFEHY
jgi:hypothetical protein